MTTTRAAEDPTHRRVRRMIALLAASALVASCGGGSDDPTPDADSDLDTSDDAEDDGADRSSDDEGGLSTGTIATAETVVPETVEFGEDYNFTMPDGQLQATFSFDVPPGAVVTLDAAASDSNRSTLRTTVGPAGQSLRNLQLDPGRSETYTYITSNDGGGRWTIDIEGFEGDTLGFRLEAPLQVDGGGVGDASGDGVSAADIEFGAASTGIVGDEDFADWYAVPLVGGDVVAIDLDMLADTGTGGVTGELVFNGEGGEWIQVYPGGSESSTKYFSSDETGIAYFTVSGNGSYGFTVSSGPQTDGGTDGDAGSDLGNAKPVPFGSFDGTLGGSDMLDVYVFDLPLDAVVTIGTSSPAQGLAAVGFRTTYNGDDRSVSDISAGQTESFTNVLINDEGDQMYLTVSGLGDYSVVIDSFSQTDGGSAGDAPGIEEQAKPITADGSFDGYLNNRSGIDGRDYYVFTADSTGPLDLNFAVDADYGGSMRLQVNATDGTRLDDLSVDAGGIADSTLDVEAGVDYVIHAQTGTQAKYTLTFG